MKHDPVPAFAALAHPQRLAVVRLLLRQYPGFVAAGDIGADLGIKPSTLSGYLTQLVEAGLITQQRRGTSLLYAVLLSGIEGLNTAWIGDVCRGRGLPDTGAPGSRVRNLVFVGRCNAGPTLIAEALLRARDGERFEVFSAGVEAAEAPDPAVMTYIRSKGYDTEALWSKPLATVTGPGAPRMDLVITLGMRALHGVPLFAGCPLQAHWTLPAGMGLGAMHDALSEQLAPLVALDPATTPRAVLQAALDVPLLVVAD